MPKHNVELRCTNCGALYPLGTLYACRRCQGILDTKYEYSSIEFTRALLRGRTDKTIWRYRDLLPVKRRKAIISMGEGNCPLFPAERLARSLGLRHLTLKDETRNPTSSFKDRPISVAVSLALEAGYRSVVNASSGNAGAATAAYAARGGLACNLIMQAESPTDKILRPLVYGAKAVLVKELFKGRPERLKNLLKGVCETTNSYNTFCWAPFNPYTLEGNKTISFEVCEQLEWSVPDAIVTPVGGGDNLAGQWKGYQEFYELGLINHKPRMIGVQAKGAAPLYEAWKTGREGVRYISRPKTIASGLRTSYTGAHALRAIRESNGTVATVSDHEILGSISVLAKTEGLWVEPSSATVIAAVGSLLKSGGLKPDEEVLCILTGSGHKDQSASQGLMKRPPVVRFDVRAIVKKLGSSTSS